MPRVFVSAAFCAALAAVACGASKIDDARELERQGKLQAAGNLLQSAAAEYRAAGDSVNLARAQGIAADISMALGHYDEAIRQASEALSLRTALGQTAAVGDDYNTLGLAYQYLSRYPAALDNYRKALASDRVTGDAEGEITRLNNVGNVYYFQGRYSEALHSYDEAGQKLESVGAAPWRAAKHQLILANLAVLFQRLGQDQRALGYYRDLAASRAADADHAMPAQERAQLLINQGVLYRRLGDPVKALELYRGAQQLFARERHPDGEIAALRNTGIVLAMDLNDLPAAQECFTRALALARASGNQRGVVQSSLYRGELQLRQGHAREAREDLAAAASGAQAAGLVEEQWKALHALGRLAAAAGGAAQAEEDYRRAIGIIESVRGGLRLPMLRSDFLADKRDVYDSLIELRLRDPAATPEEIFNWMERSRARTLMDRLRGRVALAEPHLEVIQQRLAPGTVLVEYWNGTASSAAVWMTSRQAGLVRRPTPVTPDSGLLAGIPLGERLIVVPDGALSTFPFETLRLTGSGGLLIEKCQVSYLPSARFVTGPTRARWLPPWAIEIVTLADPPASTGPFEEHWAALPGSQQEARAIAAVLPGRAQEHSGQDMQKRYLSASWRRGAPLLHLATHAEIDAESPDRSRILFAGDYLHQEEVYDLDLRGVDLVTLSACDTARGKFVRGESVQAFSQAFLAAGAGAVVSSLWRVADGPTADFMKQFYYELARGESKAGALRLAKLRFLRSGSPVSHQRYWAAFVLTGNGSSTVPRAVPWSLCLGAAALLLAGAALTPGMLRAARRWRRKA